MSRKNERARDWSEIPPDVRRELEGIYQKSHEDRQAGVFGLYYQLDPGNKQEGRIVSLAIVSKPWCMLTDDCETTMPKPDWPAACGCEELPGNTDDHARNWTADCEVHGRASDWPYASQVKEG